MEKEVIINNSPCWKIMTKIVILNFKKPFIMSELARRIEVKVSHPYLNDVKRFLIKEDVMQIVEKTNKEIYYKINNLQLALILRESLFFDYNGEIIKKTVHAYNF